MKTNIFDKIKQRHKNYKIKKEKESKKILTPGEKIISWIKTIIFALLFVMLMHSLILASFIVPTGSMENTVMTGDFLLVHKLFGPSTPQVIPIFNIPLPYKILPSISEPERGDVIVFVFPGMRDELKSNEFQYYLKRCVAIPGDTVEIINNKLYVNHKEQPLAKNGIVNYSNSIRDPRDISYTFPRGLNYSYNNYGPIRVPKKGDIIQLNALNYIQWETFILREGHEISKLGNIIKIDNKEANKYTVEKDYYFGMGDNRDHSLDSRYWGFIPREHILGSPVICWLSWEMHDEYGNEYSFLKKLTKIRWNRIGRTIE